MSANLKIVVVDPITDMEIERTVLSPLNANIVLGKCRSDDEIITLARDADGIIVHWIPITRKAIQQFTKCQIISRYGVGLDNIDLIAARERGIHVANVPDYCTEEVASQTLTFLLALSRRLCFLDRFMRQGLWKAGDGVRSIKRLRGQTLGVVGLGRIGRRVAQLAAPLGMRILGYDVQPPTDHGPVILADLETVIRESDYLTLHCPLIDATRHLINEATLRRMKPTSFLINASRGGVVDTPALVEALTCGQIAGAALDVFEEEPLAAEHPLRKLENVILTPHTAATSEEAFREIREGVARNLLHFFQQPRI